MYDELLKRLRDCTAEQNGEKTLWCQAADAIEELTDNHVGKWIETKFSRFTYNKCSVCNASYECENAEFDFNFCPNCGARMEVEHD